MDLYPLLTRDPASGSELIVTRLESPESGVVIEGNFSLGWIGRLTREQLDFVGLLLRYRNNLQRVANELGVAYNTARARLDDIVAALGGEPGEQPEAADAGTKRAVLEKLESKQIGFEQAVELLKKPKR